MAIGCLEIMEFGSRSEERESAEGLKFNICALESSYYANTEVTDLPLRVRRYISPELAYSSLFWLKHLAASSLDSGTADDDQLYGVDVLVILAAIGSFLLSSRSLHWLESLSLMGKVPNARNILVDFLRLGDIAVSYVRKH